MAPTEYASVDGLQVSLDGSVLRLRLDRADKRNALDDVMMGGLVDSFDLAGRDESVRVIELSSTGDHFCGGADIVARNAKNADGSPLPRPRVGSIQRRVPSLAHRLIPLVLNTQVPVVCKVRGWAAGIGFQLALAADFTVTATNATFWEPFTDRGFTPDSGATWMLPRIVGVARARELLMLSRRLDGTEAVEWGIAHAAVDHDHLDARTDAIIEQLASGPTVALGFTKWLLATSADVTLTEQLQNEALALELSSRSEDFREGLSAFKEKRSPDFKGR